MQLDYDIIIVGGGMVGASMASSLAGSHYKVAVIEAVPVDSLQQPSFDERTVALTYSSKLIFNAIGVWKDLVEQAYPITSIEVTNEGAFGFTCLSTKDTDTQALGFVIPTRHIGNILHQHIARQRNIDFLCPAAVEKITLESNCAHVSIKQGHDTYDYQAKLVILADGGRSGLLHQLGFEPNPKPYPQQVLVSIVSADLPHQGKAYEHFTSAGPLALLPVRDKDYALAWTLDLSTAEHRLNQSNEQFLCSLQGQFGQRAGHFNAVGKRQLYPLSLAVLNRPYKHRTLVIGNSAHLVHPVAGQGFNLGLRDVGFLYEALLAKSNTDPGSDSLLLNYSKLRERDARMVSRFTDGLIRTFTSKLPGLLLARNLGLSTINLSSLAKRHLLKRTMGLYGKQSTLALKGKLLDASHD